MARYVLQISIAVVDQAAEPDVRGATQLAFDLDDRHGLSPAGMAMAEADPHNAILDLTSKLGIWDRRVIAFPARS